MVSTSWALAVYGTILSKQWGFSKKYSNTNSSMLETGGHTRRFKKVPNSLRAHLTSHCRCFIDNPAIIARGYSPHKCTFPRYFPEISILIFFSFYTSHHQGRETRRKKHLERFTVDTYKRQNELQNEIKNRKLQHSEGLCHQKCKRQWEV